MRIITKGKHTRLGIASLILGVIAIIFAPFALPFGFLATVFGYVSYKRKDSFGLEGFILGLIGIIYGAIILVGLMGMR